MLNAYNRLASLSPSVQRIGQALIHYPGCQPLFAAAISVAQTKRTHRS